MSVAAKPFTNPALSLSRDFTLREFLISETAARHGLVLEPTVEEVWALRKLCQNVLQPLRDALKYPLMVTSGYRSPALNELIGGSSGSQHMRGEAADIYAFGMAPRDLAVLISFAKLPFDQLILEYPQHQNLGGWVHVSHAADGQQRGQILSRTKAGTVAGLVEMA